MRLAKMDGWDLVDNQETPWPLPDLQLPHETVGRSHLKAYMRAKEILLRRSQKQPRWKHPRLRVRQIVPVRVAAPPVFKSWLEHTANDN
jgi:hypothetical protein